MKTTQLDKVMKIIDNTVDSRQIRMMRDLGHEVTQEMAFSEVLAIYHEMDKVGISVETKTSQKGSTYFVHLRVGHLKESLTFNLEEATTC